jgi:predicted N-acyltransferase
MPPTGIRILTSISDVPEAAWNALVDPEATPFVEHAFLEALEHSGCASAETSWAPRHVTLWRDGRLVAAAPAYVRDDSDGDFARDWDLASAIGKSRRPYYPKLSLTVPFTPCSGRRVLVAPGEDRARAALAIVGGAREFAADEGLGTVQVLFPDAADMDLLEAAGMARRISFQYHWQNPGYRALPDFLGRFDSKHRNQLKREMAAPGKQGIAIRTIRGAEMDADRKSWGRAAFAMHSSTVKKLMWGRGWLTRDFYDRLFEKMKPSRLEFVEARRGGKLVAGAFNVAGENRLWGRYWGCLEEHPFLHFNVCLYHSVEECIRRGTVAFEGGAGGEHKLSRGFEPAVTYSAHAFTDPALDLAARRMLEEETASRLAQLDRWRSEAPVLKPTGRAA